MKGIDIHGNYKELELPEIIEGLWNIRRQIKNTPAYPAIRETQKILYEMYLECLYEKCHTDATKEYYLNRYLIDFSRSGK